MKLDDNTEGFGNCFPIAIVQQVRRPEIRNWLQSKKPWTIPNNHRTLRIKIINFALRRQLKAIDDLKANYNSVIRNIENKSWLEYWQHMAEEGIWVDHLFVQMTAWYFELDIKILTTSSQPPNPYIVISGNVNQIPNFVSGPPLLVGNYTNVHYQSLLPITSDWSLDKIDWPELSLPKKETSGGIKEKRIQRNIEEKPDSSENTSKSVSLKEVSDNFIYNSDGNK